MRFLVALFLMTAAVQADPQAKWGTSTATLGPCHDADACVTVINQLSASPDVVDAVLLVDGLMVVVHVEMGAGKEPDTVTIIAPRGCRVEPPMATIEEGRSERFRIFFPLIS